MTKKIDEKSETKQRIRQYLKSKGVDMRTAERACGFKLGYLSAGGVVGSDKLAKFITAYPEADLHYIVTGRYSVTKAQLIAEAVDYAERALNDIRLMVTNMVTDN